MVFVSGGAWKGTGKTVVVLGDDQRSAPQSDAQLALLQERIQAWLGQNLKLTLVSPNVIGLIDTPECTLNCFDARGMFLQIVLESGTSVQRESKFLSRQLLLWYVCWRLFVASVAVPSSCRGRFVLSISGFVCAWCVYVGVRPLTTTKTT